MDKLSPSADEGPSVHHKGVLLLPKELVMTRYLTMIVFWKRLWSHGQVPGAEEAMAFLRNQDCQDVTFCQTARKQWLLNTWSWESSLHQRWRIASPGVSIMLLRQWPHGVCSTLFQWILKNCKPPETLSWVQALYISKTLIIGRGLVLITSKDCDGNQSAYNRWNTYTRHSRDSIEYPGGHH